MNDDLTTPWMAGFWKRLAALAVDAIFLSLVAFFLVTVLDSWLLKMGPWVALFSFFVNWLYFGLMNSYLFAGQTLGKKFLNLKVVDAQGSTLSITRSLLRSAIFVIPLSLNSVPLFSISSISLVAIIHASILSMGIAGTLYLFLCNRKTRQTLHDLAVKTYVVNLGQKPEPTETLWRGHLMVLAIILIASLITSTLSVQRLSTEPYLSMRVAQEKISTEPDVTLVTLTKGTHQTLSNKQGNVSQTYTHLVVSLNHKDIDDVELARKFATLTLEYFPAAESTDVINVTLMHSVSIGILKLKTTKNFGFNPKQ